MAPPTKKPEDIVIHDRSAPDQRGGGTVENFEMAGTVFHTRADAERAGPRRREGQESVGLD